MRLKFPFVLTRSVCTLLGFLALASGAVGQEDDIDAQSLLKLNLSDWYWARYELAFEHVLNASTSVQFAFAGIGAEESFTNYYYNYDFGSDAVADLDIVHGGWRFTPEIRRYAWVYGGMPEGVFVSVQGRIESWNLTIDEDADDLNGFPPTSTKESWMESTASFTGVVSAGYQGTATRTAQSTQDRCSAVTRETGRPQGTCPWMTGKAQRTASNRASSIPPNGAHTSRPTADWLAFRPDGRPRS